MGDFFKALATRQGVRHATPPMNHFIYAMNSEAPAPATGGDTKSWFEYYKWDVDDFAYVPVTDDNLIGCGSDFDDYTLWFVMDKVILGCVSVHALLPSLQGGGELHYDTRLIQVAPITIHERLTTTESTGRAANQELYEVMKRQFDAQHPPRDQALAASLGLTQSK